MTSLRRTRHPGTLITLVTALGLASGLATASICLQWLARSDSPFFTETVAKASSEVAWTTRLLVYYSPKPTPAPNPISGENPRVAGAAGTLTPDCSASPANDVEEFRQNLRQALGRTARIRLPSPQERAAAEELTAAEELASAGSRAALGSSHPETGETQTWLIEFAPGIPQVEAIQRLDAALLAMRQSQCESLRKVASELIRVQNLGEECQARYAAAATRLLSDIAALEEYPGTITGQSIAERYSAAAPGSGSAQVQSGDDRATTQYGVGSQRDETLFSSGQVEDRHREPARLDGPNRTGEPWLTLPNADQIGRSTAARSLPAVGDAELDLRQAPAPADGSADISRQSPADQPQYSQYYRWQQELEAIARDAARITRQREEVTRRWMQGVEKLAVLESCRVQLVAPSGSAELPTTVVTKVPTLWAILLALVVGGLSGGAVTLVGCGIAEPKRIRRPEDVQEIIQAPVVTLGWPTNVVLPQAETAAAPDAEIASRSEPVG